MAKHRQPTTSKWRPYVTTGIALEVTTLFAFAYATDSHVTIDSMLAASTSIFVDGTKSITGNEEGIPFLRMADSLGGAYDQTRLGKGGTNVFIEYARSLGPLTGIGDPTYDASEGDATAKTVQAVKDAQARRNPGETIYVVGYSQGAGAASQAITQLEADSKKDGVNYTDGVEFVLAGDPRRTDGGILARLPKGVYVPIVGVSFGDGTTPQNTKVLQVTKQYDGVADTPDYIINWVADLNAIMGFYYLHSGYYKDVDLDAIPDEGKIVTHSADGLVTDVLIKAPVGELPLTMPLLQLGVPKEIVKALDPFLRAIIETGYARPSVVPSEPVPFQLVPPPSKWLPDVQSVAVGAAQTVQALTGTTPAPLNVNANNRSVNALVATGVSGQEDLKGMDPAGGSFVKTDPEDLNGTDPMGGLPVKTGPEDLVVPKPTGPSVVKKPVPTPNKFEPRHISTGGWKPGDLLREIFHPQPKTGDVSSDGKPSAKPESPAAPSAPSGTPEAQHNEPAHAAAS